MALSGLEIYKNLPKTNCKECGFPTCLAFAMKLAAKGVELSACPYVSEAAKQALEAAAAPPIRLVTIGADSRKIEVGNEVVLFRHEKTFYHQPGIVVRVKDTEPADQIAKTAKEVGGYSVERVGLQLTLDGIAIENTSGDPAKFAAAVKAVKDTATVPLILMSQDPKAMEAALEVAKDGKPLIYAATSQNWQEMAGLAKKYSAPLAVYSKDGLDQLAELTKNIAGAGVADLMLDPGARGMLDSLQMMTQLRRLALKKNFRALGYPIITFPGEGVDSLEEEAATAAQHVAKYAGVIVLNSFNPAVAYPLLTERLNLFTDPQKPIQVEPKLYAIGEANEKSPLLVTTNFSLTYFSVAGEVENSRIPAWLLVTDAEGMSVLTAWAAGKFDAEKIAKAVKSSGVEQKVPHKKIIIPGYVATLSGELEEELPGWDILVGTREAVDIPAYLRSAWSA
ncbi:MAG: acetyl-CoA decarbonylase/synthase complex subunit gamma [Chloroflexi bacterium]|nr:acetyl-CoA decarbonylase/synthase complex subunit gamma [Chloroflexota bacterium]